MTETEFLSEISPPIASDIVFILAAHINHDRNWKAIAAKRNMGFMLIKLLTVLVLIVNAIKAMIDMTLNISEMVSHFLKFLTSFAPLNPLHV
jgi:hypothetical protein